MSMQFDKGVLPTIEHSNDSSREHSLPPYHLFEKLGECFVYDVMACRFFRIDEATYRTLGLGLVHGIENATSLMKESGEYTESEIDGISAEIESLRSCGFFTIPDFSSTLSDIAVELDSRDHAPRTKIELALAETCNLACKYCYCSASHDNVPDGCMSRETARQALDWLFAASAQQTDIGITLFGGEPLLNRDVFKFVIDYSDEQARSQGRHVHYSVTTNATLLDDELADYIAKHDFGLMVSLDGPQHVHDQQCPFRDGRGSFTSAMEGIGRLMKRRSVTVRCTVTKKSVPLDELVTFFERCGFKRIVLGYATNPTNPTAWDVDEKTLVEIENEELRLLPELVDRVRRGDRLVYNPYLTAVHNIMKASARVSVKCGAANGCMTVAADGQLYPCHRHVGMSAFSLGNIRSGPQGTRARQFWDDYYKTISVTCNRCWAWRLCHGPCPWEVSNKDGTFHAPAGYMCDVVKRFYERAAYFFLRLAEVAPDALNDMCSLSRPNSGRASQGGP